MKRIISFILSAAVLMVCAACGMQSRSVSIADNSVTLSVGGTKALKVVTVPAESKKDLIWSSSDEAVATVSNGTVTAKAEGQSTVTAMLPTGEKATCSVIVKQKSEQNNIAAVTEAPKTTQTPKVTQTPKATQPPKVTQPPKETQPPQSSAKGYDVEAEVKQIRAWYYATQEDPGTFTHNSEVLRYTKNNATTKFSVPASYNGWAYDRWYFYHDDKLYFAFVFKGEEEYRLYFKDDALIRYIDNNGVTYDYGNISCPIEEKARTEAYELLNSNIP